MTLEKILITVKTYPSLSKKYGELVCTAGMKENGEWIRIYPIPYRKLYVNDSQYEKYRWIECDVIKNPSDPRIESFKVNYKEIKLLDFIDTKPNWNKRREVVLKNGFCTNLDTLIEQSKNTNISLATYKPSSIDDFIWKAVPREYKKDILDKLEADKMQLKLFSDPIDDVPNFKEIPKLPYEFSYVFKDDDGTSHTVMIEDWEVGAAYWNFLKHYGSEQVALEKVKDKFFNKLAKQRDLYFFMGTTRRYHGWARNPFIIIGLFYPEKDVQQTLF